MLRKRKHFNYNVFTFVINLPVSKIKRKNNIGKIKKNIFRKSLRQTLPYIIRKSRQKQDTSIALTLERRGHKISSIKGFTLHLTVTTFLSYKLVGLATWHDSIQSVDIHKWGILLVKTKKFCDFIDFCWLYEFYIQIFTNI